MSQAIIEPPAASHATKGLFETASSERLTQRAGLNAMAALLDYAAKMAVSLIITPLLVTVLGRSLYGVWEILGRLVGYMSVADGRPTLALRLVIANQQAVEDDTVKRRYVGSALAVWLLFLPILALAGIVLVWLSPKIARVSPPLVPAVRYTCTLLVFNFLLTNLVALPEAVLRGMNLGYRRMGLQAGLSIVGGILTAGAVYLSFGLIGVACAQVILTLLTGVFFLIVVKKYVSWFGAMRPTLTGVRSFLSLSVWNFLGELVAKFLLASDAIILGWLTSSMMVTTYVLTGYAAQAVLGILTISLVAMIPGIGGVIGQKQYGKAAALRDEMLAICWLAVTVIGSTILVCNRSFLHLWVGMRQYAGGWVDLLIVIMMAQTMFIRADSYVIDSTLQLRPRVLVGMGALALSIGLTFLLTRPLGMTGLCLGMIGGRMVQTILYPILSHACLHRAEGIHSQNIIRPGVITLLLFAGASYLGQRLLTPNWLEWVSCVLASLGMTFMLALVGGLPTETRRIALQRIRMLRPQMAFGRQRQ